MDNAAVSSRRPFTTRSHTPQAPFRGPLALSPQAIIIPVYQTAALPISSRERSSAGPQANGWSAACPYGGASINVTSSGIPGPVAGVASMQTNPGTQLGALRPGPGVTMGAATHGRWC